MRPVLEFALLLVSMAALCSAVSMEEKTLNFTVSEVPGLISVSTNLNTTNLLPGFEYNYTLGVRWAIPEESVSALTADEVKLYVKLQPAENGTNMYFKNGIVNVGQRYLSLRCSIVNHTCSNDSVLKKSTQVYYMLQPGGNVSIDQLSVSASLTPFADNATIDEANGLIAQLSAMSLNDDRSSRLDEAKQLADDGDYDFALRNLRDIYVETLPVPTPVPYVPPATTSIDDNWKLLVGALVILFALLAALYLGKGKKRTRKGFEGLDDYDIKGHDYDDSPPSAPENVDYSPPEPEKKPGDTPVVQRVPDWFG